MNADILLPRPPLAMNHVVPLCRNRLAPSADRGLLSDLITLLGATPGAVSVGGVPLALLHVREGAMLLLEGTPANSLYVVRSGSLKCLKTLEDGYEQVLALAQTGELLGAEALHGGRQPSTVVALEDCTVYAVPVRDLPALRKQDPQLDVALQQALSRQLVRAAETSAMTAAVASEVRLARFLIWLSGRMAEIGQSPNRLLLRMGRREIASLLCVAHETISRGFTTLAEEGYLRVDRRDVHLIDLERLHAFSRITRGVAPEAAAAPRRRPVAAPARSSWMTSLPSFEAVAA
jgi:CRP/FNR family transcriptional regulator